MPGAINEESGEDSKNESGPKKGSGPTEEPDPKDIEEEKKGSGPTEEPDPKDIEEDKKVKEKRLIYTRILESKSAAHVLPALQDIIAQIRQERRTEIKKVTRVHSDCGSEFLNSEVKEWLRSKAIMQSTTEG